MKQLKIRYTDGSEQIYDFRPGQKIGFLDRIPDFIEMLETPTGKGRGKSDPANDKRLLDLHTDPVHPRTLAELVASEGMSQPAISAAIKRAKAALATPTPTPTNSGPTLDEIRAAHRLLLGRSPKHGKQTIQEIKNDIKKQL